MANTKKYEAPALEVVGALHDVTRGGTVPINEKAGEPNVNNDAFPPVPPAS
jgi:hypothetical protein